VTLEILRRADPVGVGRILGSLPDWFGIEEANRNYVTLAGTLDSYIAVHDGSTIGVALIDRHFDESAELALIAVRAGCRAYGIGAQLVAAAEADLRADGCRYLEVHTVGPSFEHDGYADTRAFYGAIGFTPLHEFDGLEWDGPTLVMIKAL
jgi:GNAT superfamily N-acetyltransferase